MENKLKGEKFERNLSFHETAKILSTNNLRLLQFLRDMKIIFKEDSRNLPYEKYLNKKWFEVSESYVENSGFKGYFPMVRVTKIGLDNIEDLMIRNNFFIKNHNTRTFWKTVKFKITEQLKELKIKEKNFDEWLEKNTVTFTDNNDNVIIFTFINNKRFDLISYNFKEKIIND